MDLKTRVKIRLISIGCIIAIGIIGYVAYFVIKDTLEPTPKASIPKNLFIEKDSIDIANLRIKENLIDCRNLYYTIWNSIYEEQLNGFLAENKQENEKQYQTLWKRLNLAYIDQFIALTTRYFDQQNWNENDFVNQCITEIRNVGFVELNNQMLDSLQGFENSIIWYNNTQNCIGTINIAIRAVSYFRGNTLSEIKENKNNLTNQNCKINANKKADLDNAYMNLKDESFANLSSKITQYESDFNSLLDNSAKDKYIDTAYQKYNRAKIEVNQWNTVFDNSDLNEPLYNHKTNIDAYYTLKR